MAGWLGWAAAAYGWAPALTRQQRIDDLETVRDAWLEVTRAQQQARQHR